ncbi:MAG: PAS domain-containing protein, partial [Pseudomonadota bacterium]
MKKKVTSASKKVVAAKKRAPVVKKASAVANGAAKQKLHLMDLEGQIAAINKAQAVIEFSLDGKILHANDNFLNALGYSLDEVKGQHHGMFAEPAYRSSPEYAAFWE